MARMVSPSGRKEMTVRTETGVARREAQGWTVKPEDSTPEADESASDTTE